MKRLRPIASAATRKNNPLGAGRGSARLDRARITLLIPAVLDKNVELFSAREGLQKTHVVVEALTEFLRKRGVRPERLPKISW